MAGITQSIAEAKLSLWLEAEAALAASQSYTIDVEGNTRSLTRANLAEVRQQIEFWESRCAAFSSTKVTYFTPTKGT